MIVADAMVDRDTCQFSEILIPVGSSLREAKITTATRRQAVTEVVTTALSGGVLIHLKGQSVRLSVSKNGAAANSPWVVVRQSVEQNQGGV
jgi:hypothetical protein